MQVAVHAVSREEGKGLCGGSDMADCFTRFKASLDTGLPFHLSSFNFSSFSMCFIKFKSLWHFMSLGRQNLPRLDLLVQEQLKSDFSALQRAARRLRGPIEPVSEILVRQQ